MDIVLFSFIPILMAPLIHTTMAGPRTDLLAKRCADTKVQDDTKYLKNYMKNLQTLQEKLRKNQFATAEEGENPNKSYMLTQCKDDLPGKDCTACFANISMILLDCIPFTGGRVFLDGCFMRFDNYSFYQETTSETFDVKKCSNDSAASKQYAESATMLINDVVQKAPYQEGYAELRRRSSNNSSVYGMAGCWNSLDRKHCTECLEDAGGAAAKCLPNEEGQILNTGCFVRYSKLTFPVHVHKSFSQRNVIFLVLGVGSCSLLVFLLGFYVSLRFHDRETTKSPK